MAFPKPRNTIPGIRLFPAVAASLLIMTGDVHAQGIWQATPVDPAIVPAQIRPETRVRATNGLPDGLVATSNRGQIAAAWYAGPTDRYGHGVLGDAVEAAALVVRLRSGTILDITLPKDQVFEDLTPRLADLDADGRIDIVTIRSSVSVGAAVTVYGLRNGALRQIASTRFIGQANRWLNIAGIAAFRGLKSREIAYVQTPHIGGTLKFLALEQGLLTVLGEEFGFSNHAIGSRELRLSAVADVNGDGRADLALPGADRRTLRIVTLSPDGVRVLGAARLPAAIDKAIAVQGAGRETAFLVGLADAQVFRVARSR